MNTDTCGSDEDAHRVWIYRSAKRAETYVYLTAADEFTCLPADLRQAMGKLELVMEIELYPGRKLARAKAETVLAALQERGYYLQMPPLGGGDEARVH